METGYQKARRGGRAGFACAAVGVVMLTWAGARADNSSGERGGPPMPVNVVNTPLAVAVEDAREPFMKLLCSGGAGLCTVAVGNTRTPELPSAFTVPGTTASGLPVKQLTIQYVSGDCVGTARTTEVFLVGAPPDAPTPADTGDNFSVNKIPVAVAQFNTTPGANAVQSFAQRTEIVYLPGMSVSTTFDLVAAGIMRCAIQLNGYFVTQ